METRDTFDLLNRRMAICVLQINSLPGQQYIVAVSVHNYSFCSGNCGTVSAPISFASLLFDFLSKLHQTGFNYIIVAGDFNFNISTYQDPYLTQYLNSFHIPDYSLNPLRDGLKKIDTIVVTIPGSDDAKFDINVKEMQAHDLQVSEQAMYKLRIGESHKSITNHNPVSAVIEFKLKRHQSFVQIYSFGNHIAGDLYRRRVYFRGGPGGALVPPPPLGSVCPP